VDRQGRSKVVEYEQVNEKNMVKKKGREKKETNSPAGKTGKTRT